MRKSIVLCAIFMIMISGGALAASFVSNGNPGDTIAGTPITSEGTVNTFNYKDAENNNRPTLYGRTFEVTTGTFMSWWAKITPSDYKATTTPGSTVTWTVMATNEGNAAITMLGTLSAVSVTPSGGNWAADLWLNSVNYGQSLLTTIEEDSDLAGTLIKITPATTENGAPDASKGTVDQLVTTPGYGGGLYVGGNSLNYGAITSSQLTYDVSVEAPVIAITRAATVDSPTHYLGWGGVHDFVPGAVWTFTITYTNEGTGRANNVILVDRVPNNCQPYKMPVNQVHEPYVTVTAPHMTGEVAWAVYTSTLEAPSTTLYQDPTLMDEYADGWYHNMGNVFMASGIAPPYYSNGADYPFADNDSGRGYIKWVKLEATTLESGATGSVSWSVYLR